MRTGKGALIFLLMIGMILAAAGPAVLYGAETGQGNPWDQFVDPKPYPGISLEGPLSIYFAITDFSENCGGIAGVADYITTMYYTVRLSRHKDLYTLQGSQPGICMQDIATQGQIIKNFLGTVVLPQIFVNGFNSWKVKSIDDAQFNDDAASRAFVAFIEIAVMEKSKKGK